MDDRELLTRAARAAGKEITGWNKQNGVDVAVLSDGSYWQPLHKNGITDCDGDAMRLGVALKIRHRQYKGRTPETDYIEACFKADIELRELVGSDPCAATRRAVVTAAAAIVQQHRKG